MKIGIIYGGSSSEKEASTINAGCVEQALSRLGYETAMLQYQNDMVKRLRGAAPDMVFLCVQGKGHGDGTAQAVLDFLGLPYTGSRTMGAAIINDKIVCKELFQAAGIRTPPWQTLSLKDYRAGRFDFSSIGYPVMAKSPTQGLSIGIEMIESERDLSKIEAVFAFDDPILIEKFIPGHNATSGLLEEEMRLTAFPPVGYAEEGDKENYAFIKASLTAPVVARNYPDALASEIKSAAQKAFMVTRAGVYARVDFRVSCDDGLPYVLEINAVPGLRPTSMYAYGAELSGIDYDTTINTIVQSSLYKWKNNV